MAALDYNALTKTQKLAAFLIVIGPDAAAEVIKHFENPQVELICRELAELNVLDESTQRAVILEFAGIVFEGSSTLLGGMDFAQAALEKAKGAHAATHILDRIAPASRGVEGGEEIRQMEVRQIMSLIKTEQPQTIAFIFSNLEPAKAAEVMKQLPAEQREEVVERLGAMEETSRDMVAKIARNIGRASDHQGPPPALQRSGGAKAAAGILNLLDKESRKMLLAKVDERNAVVGAAIRKEVFGFDDLGRLEAADLQRVVREVDAADLAKALKSAKPALVDVILKSVSKRAAESVREEMDMLGSIKPKEINAAQDRIIQVVRKLEEADEISLESGGDEGADS
ncbi:MAG TPA: flagellar motor switch protein FliG [Chthoniobacterales bacterium]|jgi:flagellar motor switch protein FliG|nr:flagellar motor switch protein FliG [Chthoniobacterales bacterium]